MCVCVCVCVVGGGDTMQLSMYTMQPYLSPIASSKCDYNTSVSQSMQYCINIPMVHIPGCLDMICAIYPTYPSSTLRLVSDISISLVVMLAPWLSSSFTHCGLSLCTAKCSGVLPSESVQFSVRLLCMCVCVYVYVRCKYVCRVSNTCVYMCLWEYVYTASF